MVHAGRLLPLQIEKLTAEASVWIATIGEIPYIVVPTQPLEEIESQDETARLTHAFALLAYRVEVQDKTICTQQLELGELRPIADARRKVMMENERLEMELQLKQMEVTSLKEELKALKEDMAAVVAVEMEKKEKDAVVAAEKVEKEEKPKPDKLTDVSVDALRMIIEALKWLSGNKILPGTDGKYDVSAAFSAAAAGQVNVLRMLQKSGVDIKNGVNSKGVSMAFWASDKGQLAVLEYLKNELQVDLISLTNTSGNTLAHWAARPGHLHVLKWLHSPAIGENFKRANSAGNTAAHWASSCGHLSILQWMHSIGVDMAVKNKKGLNVARVGEVSSSTVKEWLKSIGL